MQFTNCTTREPLFPDPYGSYGSYESCQAIHGSYLFDSIGQAWRRRRSLLGGSGGMPPREILKIKLSETAFRAF